MDKVLLDAIAKGLPDFFPLNEVTVLTKGVMGASNLSNLIYSGLGPTVHKVGRKRFLVKEEFIPWMELYFNGMEVVRNGSSNSGTGLTVRLSEEAKKRIREAGRRAEEAGERPEGSDPSGNVC